MFLFMILALILVILVVVTVVVVSIIGAGTIIVFGDVILFIIILGWLIYKLYFKRK